MQDIRTKGTKVLVDIASMPQDIKMSTWARMIGDKLLLLEVEDRERKFNSFNVDDTTALKGWTVLYKSKLSSTEYRALIQKYEKAI